MGRFGAPLYGKSDLGSAIEDCEKIIAKIKTNKYSKDDLLCLLSANNEILKFIINENND